jgi:hypothetical protein
MLVDVVWKEIMVHCYRIRVTLMEIKQKGGKGNESKGR